MKMEFCRFQKRMYFIKTYFQTEVCWGSQWRSYLPCLPSTGWLAGCCPRNLIKATSHNFLTGKAVKGGGRLTPPSHPRQYPQTFILSIWNIFLFWKWSPKTKPGGRPVGASSREIQIEESVENLLLVLYYENSLRSKKPIKSVKCILNTTYQYWYRQLG